MRLIIFVTDSGLERLHDLVFLNKGHHFLLHSLYHTTALNKLISTEFIKSIFSIFLNYKINLHEFKYRKKQNIFIIFAVLQTSTVGFILPLTFTISLKF